MDDQNPELTCPLIPDQGDLGFDDRTSEAEAEAHNREFDMFDHVDFTKLSNSEKPSTSLHKDFVSPMRRNAQLNTNTPIEPITNTNLAHKPDNNSPLQLIDQHTYDSNPEVNTDDMADLDFNLARVEELPEINDKAQFWRTANYQGDNQPAAVTSHHQSKTSHAFDATPTNKIHHSPTFQTLPSVISGPLQQNNNQNNAQNTPKPHNHVEKLTDDDKNIENDFLNSKQGITIDNIKELDEKLCNNLYKDILEQGQKLSSLQLADVNFTHLYLYKLNKQLPIDLNLARKVMAEEDKFYLNNRGILFRKFHPQPGESMYHQVAVSTELSFNCIYARTGADKVDRVEINSKMRN